MSITKENVIHVAKLAKISVPSEELEAFTNDFKRIITFVEQINEVDTTGVAPLASIFDESTPLRADEPGSSLPIDVTEANAPKFSNNQYVVPAVIE